MIIYGSYTLTVREYALSELGPDIAPFFQAGDRLRKCVQVIHLFGIPIFPTHRLWEVRRDGQRFEVDGRAWALLDRKFGRIKAPITAYLGPLILGLLVVLFAFAWLSTSGRAMAGEALANRSSKKTWRAILQEPTKNDYLILKYTYYPQQYFFKVDQVEEDAITFAYLSDPDKPISSVLDPDNYVVQEFLFPSMPSGKVKIKKEQLEKMVDTFDDDERSGIRLPHMSRDNILVMDGLERYEDSPFSSAPGAPITALLQQFRNSKTMADRALLISQASRDHARWIWQMAQLPSIEAIRDTVAASKLPMVNFKMIAHTKYRFLEQQAATTYTAATEAAFLEYLSLLDQGWWTQNNDRIRSCCDYLDLSIKDDQTAAVTIDYVDGSTRLLGETLQLQKEAGEWKIDIPSTLKLQEMVWSEQLAATGKSVEGAQKKILELVR